jgi:hypothetical protein
MLAVEFRYLALVAAIAGVLALSLFAAIGIGVPAHLPFWAIASTWFALLAGCGFSAMWLWLKCLATKPLATLEPAMLAPETPRPKARYAPLVLSFVLLVISAFSFSSRIHDLNATHWRVGLDSFAASTLTAIVFLYLNLRSYFTKANAEIDPATQRTRDAIAAAYALPTLAERRAALRPIHLRGYVRLGLIASSIPIILVLMSHVGITFALLGSFAISAGTFLLLHRRFGL